MPFQHNFFPCLHFFPVEFFNLNNLLFSLCQLECMNPVQKSICTGASGLHEWINIDLYVLSTNSDSLCFIKVHPLSPELIYIWLYRNSHCLRHLDHAMRPSKFENLLIDCWTWNASGEFQFHFADYALLSPRYETLTVSHCCPARIN